MKRIFILSGSLGYAFLFSAIFPSKSHAQATMEVGYSSYSVTGVSCTSGTRVQVNGTRPTAFGGKIAGYRLQNQNSSGNVWIGGPSVSTSGLTNLGFRLQVTDNGTLSLSNYTTGGNSALVPIWCLAGDAGAVTLSVEWFGY